jgi:hypothetical protein
MTDVEHVAARPSWDCRKCGKPWPCTPAKRKLLDTLSPTQLVLQMWVYLEDAAIELQLVDFRETFHRFISWTWPEYRTEFQPPPE